MSEDSLYYGVDGERYGPVTHEQLLALIGAGQLGAGDYLWNEARDEWVSFAELPEYSAALSAAAQSGPVAAPPAERPFAGFFLRLAAHLIDVFFLMLPAMAWSMIVLQLTGVDPESFDPQTLGADPFSAANREQTMQLLRWQAWFYGGLITIEWLYRAGLESSPLQGTLGKRVLGLVVVDDAGYRISFGRATLRYFCKALSILPLGLGYLVILVHERRQGLHDQLAGTLVLRN